MPVQTADTASRRSRPMTAPPDMRYTLCFLLRDDRVLMLKRERPPNLGLWNGVGGKIMSGETPAASCLREVREETGFHLRALRFHGILTWEGYETPPGGLYIFSSSAFDGEMQSTPEGTLRWQPRAWMLSSPEVVDNIHVFGPTLFQPAAPRWWHFAYDRGRIRHWQAGPLPAWVKIGGRLACCRP